jgi:hypothetical protein
MKRNAMKEKEYVGLWENEMGLAICKTRSESP